MKVSFSDNTFAQQTVRFINNTDRHLFLTGKAGTGKTTLLKHIVDHTHKNYIIVAPTGIAAINAEGVTIHSMFQLPFGSFLPTDNIDVSKESFLEFHTPTQLLKKSKLNSRKRRLLHQMELLIIDEVSMLRADILDAIDLVLRFVRKNRNPFGGVQILFIGDMLQLPPVVKDLEWNLLSRFYKSMFFFDALVLQNQKPLVIELNKIYRQSDKDFIAILNNFRENKITEKDIKLLNQFYIPDFKPKAEYHYIYLTTHNRKADRINQTELDAIKLKDYTYSAYIDGDFPDHLYPIEFDMTLKVGAQVMFIKNDYSGLQQYYNGKIGQIAALTDRKVSVTFNDGSDVVEVERYTWENKRFIINKKTNDIEEHIIGTFTHFPLRLAWAVTIHKSQGLTFERAIIDVSEAFAPGQMYVALSRLISLDGLVLSQPLGGSGPNQNKRLLSFTNNKSDEKTLEKDLKKSSQNYIYNFLLDTFDYSEIRTALDEHIDSYDKDENRSEKQKHLEWAKNLKKDFEDIDEIAVKFSRQLLYIKTNDPDNYAHLLKRLRASKKFFFPKLFKCINAIFALIGQLSTSAGVKNYVAELRIIESMFFERQKRINKSIVILDSAINSREIGKDYIDNTDIINNRQASRKELTKKQKKPSKSNTKDITLAMFHEGKDIDSIANERSITRKTVENHLAYYISDGILTPTEFMSYEKQDIIEDTIKEHRSKSIKNIVKHLPEGFEEWEVKFVLAGMEMG